MSQKDVADKMEHEMDFGVVRVGKMDWFNKMVHIGRAWEDETVGSCLGSIILRDNGGNQISTRSISPDHNVGKCIKGFKLLANISWNKVDEVFISVNVSKSFHWILVVFRIKHMSLHV
ncbi:uncharacterized protein LOC129898625 [Solanum dulcamara]|uniref:uncharacterized protein LOC129898625 n=1 Tax=Solanum dulcamara TaxID=45834 RepID=UPI0024865011|nr:uncharacterized protein LOC129898625 [Solanum dulcamara]